MVVEGGRTTIGEVRHLLVASDLLERHDVWGHGVDDTRQRSQLLVVPGRGGSVAHGGTKEVLDVPRHDGELGHAAIVGHPPSPDGHRSSPRARRPDRVGRAQPGVEVQGVHVDGPRCCVRDHSQDPDLWRRTVRRVVAAGLPVVARGPAGRWCRPPRSAGPPLRRRRGDGTATPDRSSPTSRRWSARRAADLAAASTRSVG